MQRDFSRGSSLSKAASFCLLLVLPAALGWATSYFFPKFPSPWLYPPGELDVNPSCVVLGKSCPLLLSLSLPSIEMGLNTLINVIKLRANEQEGAWHTDGAQGVLQNQNSLAFHVSCSQSGSLTYTPVQMLSSTVFPGITRENKLPWKGIDGESSLIHYSSYSRFGTSIFCLSGKK